MPQRERRQKSRRFPTSGDNNIDWEFRRVVDIIERLAVFIKTKRVLRDPKDRRKILLGLLTGDNEIWISVAKKHRKRSPATRILIHEAVHIFYPRFVWERYIEEKEEILWKRFTDEQKLFLRGYIPKRASTQEPRDKKLIYHPKESPFSL